MSVSYIRKGSREPDEVTAVGARWLARQKGSGLVLYGGTRGALASIALLRQLPEGVPVWTHHTRKRDMWVGGSILLAWAYPRLLDKYSAQIERANNILALEWVPGELDAWLHANNAEEYHERA